MIFHFSVGVNLLPDYFGHFRDQKEVYKSINMTLPSFLFSVFEPSGDKKPKPVFKQDVEIKNGRLEYVK